jgi:hypothetical protein
VLKAARAIAPFATDIGGRSLPSMPLSNRRGRLDGRLRGLAADNVGETRFSSGEIETLVKGAALIVCVSQLCWL